MTTIRYRNPETGKIESKTIAITNNQLQQIEKETKLILDTDKIQQLLDNMDISAEMKILLDKIINFTVTFGSKIIQIGKKIVEFLVGVYLKYPNMVKGAVLGAILGFLISSIPMIGFLFSWTIPLLAAIGAAKGFFEDSNKEIKNSIYNLIDDMFKTWKEIK